MPLKKYEQYRIASTSDPMLRHRSVICYQGAIVSVGNRNHGSIVLRPRSDSLPHEHEYDVRRFQSAPTPATLDVGVL